MSVNQFGGGRGSGAAIARSADPAQTGARWSADRAQAWELQGGNENARKIISLQAAAEIAGRIGLQVPSDTYVYG